MYEELQVRNVQSEIVGKEDEVDLDDEKSEYATDELSSEDRIKESSSDVLFDPFQVFEVNPQKCHIFEVHVIDGKDITKGWISSLLRSPDLYVVMHIPGTPNGYKRTKTIGSCANPIWDETFTFLVNPESEIILEIDLMDANLLRHDTKVGGVKIDLKDILLNEEVHKEVVFEKGSKVHMKVMRTENSTPDLRFSLTLSNEEKEFLVKRRTHVFEGMKKFLNGEDAPRNLGEVPTVGVICSGGGFRAMVGLCGTMKALEESGLLDCVIYLATLSGSSWYTSFLYSQPEFPEKAPYAFQEKLKGCVCQNNWLKLVTPGGMYGYISAVLQKSKSGQPVSLTDFYGHLVGDTILRDKESIKLSDQTSKLVCGLAPLPLYTCINVKRNVSARVFQDWIEFSPYEIGFSKYGTFMKAVHFGSKFFMGKILKVFDEQPLHFLQGVWGSAFCILFKRLIQERETKSISAMSVVKLSEQELLNDDESVLKNYVPKDDELELNNDSGSSADEIECPSIDDDLLNNADSYASASSSQGHDGSDGAHLSNSPTSETSTGETMKLLAEVRSPHLNESKHLLPSCGTFTNLPNHITAWQKEKLKKEVSKHDIHKSFWEKTLDNLFKSSIMNTRAGRAGLIFNPMRGLNLTQTFPFSPFSPTTADDDMEFKGHLEPVEVQAKRLFLVDSGLTFNMPYPLLLRPQRGVDLYLSFDFSVRGADDSPPFKEILTVEKWARLNKVSFPPIQDQVTEFLKEPLKEYYLFEDVNDPYCPIIVHFILLNEKFRNYKAPGVERTTKEEKDFGDFNIFSDPKDPYSVFNFAYSQLQFDRLTCLSEFNALIGLPLIREQFIRAISRKRNLPPKPPIKLSDITQTLLLTTNTGSLEKLRHYVKSMTKMHDIKMREESLGDEVLLSEISYEETNQCQHENLTQQEDTMFTVSSSGSRQNILE